MVIDHLADITRFAPEAIDLFKMERPGSPLRFKHFLLHFCSKKIPSYMYAQAARLATLGIRRNSY